MTFLEFTFSSVFHFVGMIILIFVVGMIIEQLVVHVCNAFKRKDEE